MSGAAARRERCLVLGFDRSEGARHAADWAVRELLPDGRLVIVHACRPLHGPPSPLAGSHEREQLGRAVVDELLLAGADEVRDLDLVVEVLDEDPVSALIDAAERQDARAIVLGRDPHTRLRWAMGVVTSELLKRSPVPVISVPADA